MTLVPNLRCHKLCVWKFWWLKYGYFPHKSMGEISVLLPVAFPDEDYCSSLHQSTGGAQCVNTLRPRQNGRHLADDMFKCIFLNENVWIPIEISLKFVPKGSINNNLALFQIMAWRRPGDKPLSETMTVSSLTHICVTRPQWVKNVSMGSTDTERQGLLHSPSPVALRLSVGCETRHHIGCFAGSVIGWSIYSPGNTSHQRYYGLT